MSNFGKSKFNVNEFLKKAGNTKNDEVKAPEDVNDFINKNLTPSQAKEVKEVLGDEDKMKTLLSSREAKEVFKKFFGGNKNG